MDTAGDRIKAVLFDMDGLMFDTEALNMKGWQAAGKKHGWNITEEAIREHIGSNLESTRRLMRERFGEKFDFDAVRKDRIDYAFAHIEKHGTPLRKGLRELLAFLKERRLKTAIASSSETRFVRFYLEHAALDYTFDALICGDMVRAGKPEPDIFLLAARTLETAPGNCLVLEDSRNGILAAHRAHIRAVMIPDLVPPTPETDALCFRRVESLLDVIPLIDAMNGPRHDPEIPKKRPA